MVSTGLGPRPGRPRHESLAAAPSRPGDSDLSSLHDTGCGGGHSVTGRFPDLGPSGRGPGQARRPGPGGGLLGRGSARLGLRAESAGGPAAAAAQKLRVTGSPTLSHRDSYWHTAARQWAFAPFEPRDS